jgi:hypothetical protein
MQPKTALWIYFPWPASLKEIQLVHPIGSTSRLFRSDPLRLELYVYLIFEKLLMQPNKALFKLFAMPTSPTQCCQPWKCKERSTSAVWRYGP